jgi:hypothetical protein
MHTLLLVDARSAGFLNLLPRISHTGIATIDPGEDVVKARQGALWNVCNEFCRLALVGLEIVFLLPADGDVNALRSFC